jgi:hypothetical protein
MNRRAFIISGAVAGSYVGLMRAGITSLFEFNRSRPTLGLIGLGTRGLRRLEETRGNTLVTLKAICDVDEQRLHSALAKVHTNRRSADILATRDAARIFADPQIEAVAIAASGSATARLIKQAVNAGKHVLIEAPWAGTLSESAAIAGTASQTSKVVHQCTYDPDWDDDYFDAYVASAQQDVVFAHLSIAIGATDPTSAPPILFEGFDLLGVVTRWIKPESKVHITSISNGPSHPLGDRADVRFSFPSAEDKHIVMSIIRTPNLRDGELKATIETRTNTGQRGLFNIHSEALPGGKVPVSKSLVRFLDLSARPPRDQALSAQRSHQLNSLVLSAQESLTHRRNVRIS